MPVTLPYSFPPSDYVLTGERIRANQEAVDRLLAARGIDLALVTSQDRFLSEYTPPENNLRYALTGFDGSTGNGFLVREGRLEDLGCRARFVLFVDGRYTIQADRQTDPAMVQVEKPPLPVRIWEAMATWLGARASRVVRIGFDPYRVSAAQRRTLDAALTNADIEWIAFEEGELDAAAALPGWRVDRPITQLSPEVTGRTVAGNLAALRQAMSLQSGDLRTAFISCAADDLGWLLNSRGHHLPNAASHLGYLFVLPQRTLLYLPDEVAACAAELDPADAIEVIRNDRAALLHALEEAGIERVCYRADAVNLALLQWTRRAWPNAQRDSAFHALEAMRARKTPQELAAIRAAFDRSSVAVAQAMRFAKYGHGPAGAAAATTEGDLADALAAAYREQGAVAFSFSTISAAGENAALMHYKHSGDGRALGEGELVLLDSGAYYDEGFATDCTRTVLRNAGGTDAAPWQKEIYTVTLKACLAGMRTVFDRQTIGEDVDRLVRGVVRSHGYDYACGTGHGIGIHVHEGGIGFNPGMRARLAPDMVVSVEPGIYLDGRAGVRIENVIVTRAGGEEGEGDRIALENIIHVGYDWDLVDLSLLSDAERATLADYERACRARGTDVTPCPLLD